MKGFVLAGYQIINLKDQTGFNIDQMKLDDKRRNNYLKTHITCTG
jgi:hypothetical protein